MVESGRSFDDTITCGNAIVSKTVVQELPVDFSVCFKTVRNFVWVSGLGRCN